MEAEFVAASHTAQELLGMRELLNELGINVEMPMVMHLDSQSAIAQVENEASSMKAKHIDVRIKFLEELHKHGSVQAVLERC